MFYLLSIGAFCQKYKAIELQNPIHKYSLYYHSVGLIIFPYIIGN